MLAGSIPQVFSKAWFWGAIWVSLLVIALVIRRYRGDGLRPPEPHPFFQKHKKAIRLGSDIFIIAVVSALVAFALSISVADLSRALREEGFTRGMDLRFAWSSFTGGTAIASRWGSALIGMLSVFQSHITATKRIILFVLCLLPIAFAVPSLAIASSELGWRSIPLGILGCAPSWIVNGPAVLTGQPWTHIMWRIMCRLRLVSGDYPEWW
jgi:hypothetical protein